MAEKWHTTKVQTENNAQELPLRSQLGLSLKDSRDGYPWVAEVGRPTLVIDHNWNNSTLGTESASSLWLTSILQGRFIDSANYMQLHES